MCRWRLFENVYEQFVFHMQRNTVFEGFEEGSDVGKAMHMRVDFGRSVWQCTMETQKCQGVVVRLHMGELGT